MSHCLLTAGATRNPVDAIRYLSAHASGRTGVALAHALDNTICATHLLGSAEALLRQAVHDDDRTTTEEYRSTRDLMSRMEAWVRLHPTGGVVHSAAVGDYEAVASGSKIKSGASDLTLTLRPTPKILDQLRGWGLTGPLVSFKAASPETTDAQLVDIARAQLVRSDSDLVFANIIGRTTAGVYLVSADSAEEFDQRAEAITALASWLQARLA